MAELGLECLIEIVKVRVWYEKKLVFLTFMTDTCFYVCMYEVEVIILFVCGFSY